MSQPEGEEWRDLPPQQQLAYLTGILTRWDVMVEVDLTQLLRTLSRAVPDHTVRIPKRKDFTPVLDACRELLAKHRIRTDPELMAAAEALLSTAEEVHRRRNRVVHDVWAHVEGTEGTFTPTGWDIDDPEKFFGAWEPANYRTLADFEAMCDEYLELSARLFHLDGLLTHVGLGDSGDWQREHLDWVVGRRSLKNPSGEAVAGGPSPAPAT